MRKLRTTENKPYNLRKVGGIAKSNERTYTVKLNVVTKTVKKK